MFIVKSKVIRQEANHDEYYKVRQIVTNTDDVSYARVLDDCQHFSTRAEAFAAIPELDRNLKLLVVEYDPLT